MSTTESQTTDPQAAAAAVMEGLVGPGGPFELVADDVRGTRLPVCTELSIFESECERPSSTRAKSRENA